MCARNFVEINIVHIGWKLIFRKFGFRRGFTGCFKNFGKTFLKWDHFVNFSRISKWVLLENKKKKNNDIIWVRLSMMSVN